MNCPLCDSTTRVLVTDGPKRRRECMNCRHRFNTCEIPVDQMQSWVMLDTAITNFIKVKEGMREGVL